MASTMTFKGADGEEISFLIEDSRTIASSGPQPKGRLTPKANDTMEVERNFGTYFDPIRRLADQLVGKISEIDVKPAEVEVTVGVKLTSKAGMVFVSAGADAEMTVKLVWRPSA